MVNGIRARGPLSAIAVRWFIVVGLAACAREADERAETPTRKPQQAGQPLDPARTAAHIAGARVAALTGNPKAAEAHIRAIGDDLRRSARRDSHQLASGIPGATHRSA